MRPSGYGAIPTTVRPSPAAAAAAPVATSTPADELLSRFKSNGRALVSSQRPWGELFNLSALSAPTSTAEASARLRRNLAYFRSNYALLLLAVLLVSLLAQPLSLLLVLAVAAAWYFLYFARDQPLVVYGHAVDERLAVIGLYAATVVILVATGVGWNVFLSVLAGSALIAAHAAFRTTDDLFLDEQQAAEGGLVSAVGGYPSWPSPSVRVEVK